MSLAWEPGNNKQTMQYAFASAVTMVKSYKYKMSKLFSCYCDHYDMVKCYQRNEFWRTLIRRKEKLMGFDYCEEYLRSISKNYYGSVIKSKCSCSCHLQILIKKTNNLKEDSKLIQTLIFPKLPSAFEVLIRRNIM